MAPMKTLARIAIHGAFCYALYLVIEAVHRVGARPIAVANGIAVFVVLAFANALLQKSITSVFARVAPRRSAPAPPCSPPATRSAGRELGSGSPPSGGRADAPYGYAPAGPWGPATPWTSPVLAAAYERLQAAQACSPPATAPVPAPTTAPLDRVRAPRKRSAPATTARHPVLDEVQALLVGLGFKKLRTAVAVAQLAGRESEGRDALLRAALRLLADPELS